MDRRERQDGHHVVEWVAQQEWCNGAVGVWGTSYGGITSMAIAETRPPHLKAIVPVLAPDDNYAAMMVHHGSRLMFWPDPHWGANMVGSNFMAPLRYDGTGDWLRMWRKRLEADPWILDWHGEPPSHDHWIQHRTNSRQINVPTLVIGGWQDAYPDGSVQIFGDLAGPKRLIIGPWKHVFPEQSLHEPVGILAEIDRWWDHWLKDEPTSVNGEPPVTIFVQGIDKWRNEQEWPPARAAIRCFYLGEDGRLTPDLEQSTVPYDEYAYDARAGLAALPYDACTGPIPYPQDQSGDDYLSLCYTTEPLSEALEVTGQPEVQLQFSATAPLEDVNLVVKLCDVTAVGQSFLVTHDNLNAALASVAEPIKADTVHSATIRLRPTAYVFLPGHRLRLAISGSNFPHIWPTPRQYRLRIHRATVLNLPVVPPQAPSLPLPQLTPPLQLRAEGGESSESYRVRREMVGRSASFEGTRRSSARVEPGVTLSIDHRFVMEVDADHPENATSRTTALWKLSRPTGAVDLRAETVVTLHEVSVETAIDLDGYPFFRRGWRKSRS
jgi:putative CocE/NonD family hydrolase